MALSPEKLELYKKQQALKDEDFLAMSEVEFRARFRERIHHTLEIQTYSAAYRHKKLNATQADYAKRLMAVWVKRGLSTELSDYVYATKIVSIADRLVDGKEVDLSEFAPHSLSSEGKNGFFQVLKERRSVREYTDQEVPDELIDEILEAGLWAAHSCNLQSIRYLVVRENKEPGLFVGSDIPGGPVHLVVLQDERVYLANQFMPIHNRLLDAGAAAQNIALATHALGLEGVWLTFDDSMVIRLREHFKLPEYIKIITYVDIGYGDQTPYPPQRGQLKDVVLGRNF